MNRLNLLLILIATLLVAAYASWLLDTFRQETRQARQEQPDVPDYTLDEFTLARFDARGHLQQRLSARHGRHYPAGGRIELDRLRLEVTEEMPPWTLEADSGLITEGGDRIRLMGAVTARRPATETQPALQLQTRDLLVLTALSRAETAARAELQAGPHRLRGTGLNLDWRQRRLRLLADVESRYVLAP